MRRSIYILSIILCLSLPAVAQQKDNPNCKDHALFTRMPNSWLYNCKQKEFDAYSFPVGQGKTVSVEGQLWGLTYYPQASVASRPSELQILRNFENAIKNQGGRLITVDKSRETLQLNKGGKEIWIQVWAEFTGKYGFTIVEKKAMAQDIVANADVFSNDIRNTGHAAIYGILFDTGKSELKPESEQAIGEIAKLLTGDAALKVYVVGHTDNVGGLESNMKLSQDRANAVVQALIGKHGIAAARLKAFGNGPYAPVASNATEEGKAKNRRVELVQQ